MEHKYFYLVFTKTGTWLSKIIYTFSDIQYPHSSISFDNNFTEMYSFGRTKPNNPFSGGFAIENLHEGVFRKFPESDCLIYRVKVTEEQYIALQQQVENFLREKDKYKYNLLGLLGVLLNIQIKRKSRYFCSQFVAEILINSKIIKYDKVPELISTSELYAIENKELIYKGYVSDYTLIPNNDNITEIPLDLSFRF
jgi:hypothetical protein